MLVKKPQKKAKFLKYWFKEDNEIRFSNNTIDSDYEDGNDDEWLSVETDQKMIINI